ncbi:YdeI family protein [Marinicella sp. W31]|uniref:YdeI/OmpD-associated family protein n=1 Tax=Marinicella sp. W31 TaxID=3023713 RepID=UPI0037564012
MNTQDKLAAYFEKNDDRAEELNSLRQLILHTELEETIKWGAPTYTLDGKNVVALGCFKSYVGLWFYQGVFIDDTAGKLINAQPDKTKGLRQWRFENQSQIDANRDLIKDYIDQAIANQKAGKAIKLERKTIPIPEELQLALSSDSDLKTAFQQLTPGKQNEYAEYIGSAKQPTTRQKRLQKCQPMIIEGISLNDRYRS